MSAAIRPSFSLDLSCPSRLVLERLFARLGPGRYPLRRTRSFGGAHGAGRVRERDHFILTVPEAEQRIWSPWLNVEVTPQGDGSRLFARFSPHPSVWTLFAFAYLGLSTVFLLSLCVAGAQSMSRSSPWALGVSAAAALVMLAMWGAAQIGQRLARAQMEELRAELEQAIHDCLGAEFRGESGGGQEEPLLSDRPEADRVARA
jgi:hypothetical protein